VTNSNLTLASRPVVAGILALVAGLAASVLSAAPPAHADPLARPSVAADEPVLSSSFDGLGFDVELRYAATFDAACPTGWVKPVLYAADGTGYGPHSVVIRSLGWRELTAAGSDLIGFRVTEPGAYGVALLTPEVVNDCIEGPAEVADTAAATAEIDLVRTPTVNLSVPIISGTAKVGATLTATAGSWQGPMLDYGYQWLRSGVAIDGATASSYTLAADDLGATVSVRVTATSPHDSADAVSAVTAKVALGTIPAYTPVITGVRTVGSTLEVTVPEGSSYRYQWYRGTTKISGATGPSYTLVSADGGSKIKVVTVASRPGYASLTRTSTATATATVLKKLTTRTPTISGIVRVGTALTVVPGTWGPSPVTLRYQWFVDGTAISGATGTKFTPRAADLGKVITVAVTGSKSAYASATKTSAASAPVALGAISLPAPKISGTVHVGKTLTASVGTTAPAATSLTFAYQWSANGVEIDGATSRTFVPTTAEIGKRLTVRVTATSPAYVTRASTSAATSPVLGVLSSPKPVLSGTARIAHTVCVDPGTWTPGPTLSYSWYLNTTKLSTTSRCVKITSVAWQGKRLTAKVTGKLAGYVTLTVSSAASEAIYVPNRTDPIRAYTCPSWAPIKGNADSMIYHMPWQRFYKVTDPEDCFRTEAAAKQAGYRKSKV